MWANKVMVAGCVGVINIGGVAGRRRQMKVKNGLSQDRWAVEDGCGVAGSEKEINSIGALFCASHVNKINV